MRIMRMDVSPVKWIFQHAKLIKEIKQIVEFRGHSGDAAYADNQLLMDANNDEAMLDNPPSLIVSFEMSKNVAVTEKRTCLSPVTHVGNDCLAVKGESFLSNHKEDGLAVHDREVVLFSGVKRPRVTVDDQQPSVQVAYKSLTRDSKRKLEELLQQMLSTAPHQM
ncbi:hypothetical protein ACH5RR_014156 [Cinchona calisaya]|uniref:Uncharacterized protein n=1 Tax=Cinchona calisaya TaxID=153742 RepID=A0ABD3A3G7_9GENT